MGARRDFRCPQGEALGLYSGVKYRLERKMALSFEHKEIDRDRRDPQGAGRAARARAAAPGLPSALVAPAEEGVMNAPVTPRALGDPWTLPLDRLDVADPQLFQDDVWPDWFARLRRDDPVHFHGESRVGPFWSVTKYADIITVEATPAVFSSASGI